MGHSGYHLENNFSKDRAEARRTQRLILEKCSKLQRGLRPGSQLWRQTAPGEVLHISKVGTKRFPQKHVECAKRTKSRIVPGI